MNAQVLTILLESFERTQRESRKAWDFLNSAPLARTGDPDTSKAAAKSLTQSGARDIAKNRVLNAVVCYAGAGMTSHELSSIGNIDHPTMHKRLPDLRRDGEIVNGVTRKCGITGRQSLTWKVK